MNVIELIILLPNDESMKYLHRRRGNLDILFAAHVGGHHPIPFLPWLVKKKLSKDKSG